MSVLSRTGLLRDSLVSLSLANLIMLPEWTDLGQFHSSAAYYLVELPPPLTVDWATLVNTLVVALVLVFIVRSVRNPDKKRTWPFIASILLVSTTAYGVCLFCLQSLNTLAENWDWLAEVYSGTFVWFATMLIAAHLVARNLDRAVRGAPSLLLVFVPIAALNIGLFAMRLVNQPTEQPIALRAAPREAQTPTKGKLVWLVLDELSEQAIDAAAAHGVAFEQFRRFRETALSISEARSPALWTLAALPALTTGSPICSAIPDSIDSLRLEVQDQAEPSHWETTASIFEQAAEANRAVGVVGWYHPYCRLFGKFATTCVTGADEMSIFRGWFSFADSIGPWRTALRQWTRNLEAEAAPSAESHAAGAPLDQLRDAQRRRTKMTSRLLKASEEAVRDDRLGFVMLHLPIPHPPGQAVQGASSEAEPDYFNNLELADTTLGMVRTAMEEEGTWEASTVIVIADHGLRDFWNDLPVWSTDEEQFRQSLDPLHVPFMVKMPHQEGASNFDVPISSTAVYELSVQAMNGRITSSEEALKWFEKNAGDHPPVCLSRGE